VSPIATLVHTLAKGGTEPGLGHVVDIVVDIMDAVRLAGVGKLAITVAPQEAKR
jgi:hypothetical protein